MRRLFDRILARIFAPVSLAPESVERLRQAAARGTLLYVARTLSLVEFLSWRHVLAKADLPLPLGGNGLTRRASPDLFARVLATGRSVFFFLRRGRLRAPAGFGGGYEEAFLAAAAPEGRASRPILAVPVALVWRGDLLRGEARPRWWEALLGAQEEPGPIRRLLELAWRRARAEAIVGEPIDLAEFSAEHADARPELRVRRLRFALSGSLERARRARLGPRRKSARRIRQEVARTRRVVQAVEEAGRQLGRERARRRAERYLGEIAANLKPWTIALLRMILLRIWKQIYEGVEVDREGIERVRAAAHRGPLLLVPSHRSHVDYLVLTNVLIDHDLAPPLIAAGANLSFFPLGFLFRRGGAFFLRRSFSGDRLYATAFREYVRKVLREGYSIEFFIEGGRSRTGKLLQPKLGLLGMIADVVLDGEAKDVQVVPVSIAYDKVIEERSYVEELSGGQKRREDLGALVRTTRVLASNYGRLYVHFDEPFDLAAEVAGAGDGDRRAAVRRLAHRILWGITRASPVTPTALVAAALLASGRRGVVRATFLAGVRFLAERARASSAAGAGGRLAPALLDERGGLREAAIDRSIELLEHDGDVQIRGTAREPIYVVPEERRLHLDYYRNSAIHALVADALVATGLLAARRAAAGGVAEDGLALDARRRTLALSRLLKNEFVYEVGSTFDAIYDRTWERLHASGTLADTPSLELLAGLVRDFVESYYVVARGLREEGADVSARGLLLLGERLYLEGAVSRREALSRSNFDNALDAFRSGGVAPEPEAIAALLL